MGFRSVLVNFLRLFMVSPITKPYPPGLSQFSFLFPKDPGFLQGVVDFNSAVLEPGTFPQFVKSVIISASFHKRHKRKKHEFILVKIRQPGYEDYPAVICLERVSNEDSSSIDIASPSLDEEFASDRIIRGGERGDDYFTGPHISLTKPSEKLADLTFSDPSFSVVDLAVLLKVVHEHKPNYNLYSSQCYWFAAVIWVCLQRLGRAEERMTPQSKLRMGKYLPWWTQRPEGVDEICEKYAEERAAALAQAEEEVREIERGRQEALQHAVQQGRQEMTGRLRMVEAEKEQALQEKERERKEKEHERREKEHEREEKERERMEKEQALQRGDREKEEKEQALRQGERERKEKEHEREEKERERREKEQALRQGEREREEKERIQREADARIAILEAKLASVGVTA